MIKIFNKKTTPIPNYIIQDDFAYEEFYHDHIIIISKYCGATEKYKLKSHEIMMDYFVFNTKTKEFSYEPLSISDSFKKVFENMVKNIKLEIKKNNNTINIYNKKNHNLIIRIQNGKIIYLNVLHTNFIPKNFLYYNDSLKTLLGLKIQIVLPNFLKSNSTLKEIYIPEVLKLPKDALLQKPIRCIYAPKIKEYPLTLKDKIIKDYQDFLSSSNTK